jgi:molybdopterin-containing oxidoreductase family iron-sulfur binding subunit
MQNHTPKGIKYLQVGVKEVGAFPHTTLDYAHSQCQHCLNPACVPVCPTGALTKDAETGIVSVDLETCIGCRTCEMACPYGARRFIEKVETYYDDVALSPWDGVAQAAHAAMKVEACNLCKDRVAGGAEPACVAECPWFARTFGDLDDPKSEVAMLIAREHAVQRDKGTDPSLFYVMK